MKKCLRAYADSEGPDQPAHSRRLIWAFAVRLQNYSTLHNVSIPGCDFEHVQDDVYPHILCMLEGTFSLDAGQLSYLLFRWMILKTTQRIASTMPAAAKHDIAIYKYFGIRSSISVINVESRGGTPSVKIV